MMEDIIKKVQENLSEQNAENDNNKLTGKSFSNSKDVEKKHSTFNTKPNRTNNMLKTILNRNTSQKQNNDSNQLSDSKSVSQKESQFDEKLQKKKGIFQQYQERWSKNNKNIFRKLIIWRVGDDEKIEDQLKLMISYLTIIFVLILFISGAVTSFYFNITNKNIIEDTVLNQGNSIIQYQNQTEEIFGGYEYILSYITDIYLTKLGVSNKLIDFDTIDQFPLLGPGKMHYRTDPQTQCKTYTGKDLLFDSPISLECSDWYQYDLNYVPLVHDDVYQGIFPTSQIIDSFDVLNYIMEEQFFDYFTTNIQNVYIGIEQQMTIIMFPGFYLGGLDVYNMVGRPWYAKTRDQHLNASDNKVYRVVSQPYDDAILQGKVITISRSILLPNKMDTKKMYQVGKGQFLGVISIDIVLKNFQQMFENLHFYETGFFMMVDYEGYPINEQSQFKQWITKDGEIKLDDTVEINISMFLKAEDWLTIRDAINNDDGDDDTSGQQQQQQQEFNLMDTTSLQNLDIIIASKVNSKNYYQAQSMINLIIVPKKEVYGEIQRQNDLNFKNLLISSFVSFGAFFVLSLICSFFIKKMIVKMVSSITELNQSALNLIDKTDDEMNSSPKKKEDNSFQYFAANETNEKGDHRKRKEVMETLKRIQRRTESSTIQQLVKGFQNQLQGISKLGKGEQNILRNKKSGLSFEKRLHSNTKIMEYIDPLLSYINTKPIDVVGSEYDLHHQSTISEKINLFNTTKQYNNNVKQKLEDVDINSSNTIGTKLQFLSRKFQFTNTLQTGTINWQTQEILETHNNLINH